MVPIRQTFPEYDFRVAETEWREMPIADATPCVSVSRLRVEDGGAIWILVRFPAGWSRPQAGSYSVEEEFWLLEGDLELSGVRHSAGAHVLVAADEIRTGSQSVGGALAVARFGGRAEWSRSR